MTSENDPPTQSVNHGEWFQFFQYARACLPNCCPDVADSGCMIRCLIEAKTVATTCGRSLFNKLARPCSSTCSRKTNGWSSSLTGIPEFMPRLGSPCTALDRMTRNAAGSVAPANQHRLVFFGRRQLIARGTWFLNGNFEGMQSPFLFERIDICQGHHRSSHRQLGISIDLTQKVGSHCRW